MQVSPALLLPSACPCTSACISARRRLTTTRGSPKWVRFFSTRTPLTRFHPQLAFRRAGAVQLPPPCRIMDACCSALQPRRSAASRAAAVRNERRCGSAVNAVSQLFSSSRRRRASLLLPLVPPVHHPLQRAARRRQPLLLVILSEPLHSYDTLIRSNA